MTLWEYDACVVEWNESQDQDAPVEPPSREDYYEGLEAMRARQDPSIQV